VRTIFLSLITFFFLIATGHSEDKVLIERLYSTLRINEILSILSEEGISSGELMADGQGGLSPSTGWTERLEEIYSVNKMDKDLRQFFNNVANLKQVKNALDFFETSLGKKITEKEISARLLLEDQRLKSATTIFVKKLKVEQPDIIKLYEKLIDANDHLENNISGIMNSNLAFYRGFASVPKNDGDTLSEDEILRIVMNDQERIRKEVEQWLINFSSVAYESLSKSDLYRYISLSRSPGGLFLNKVINQSLEAVFESQSFNLGRTTAEFLQKDDT
jgi:hypothetical protein